MNDWPIRSPRFAKIVAAGLPGVPYMMPESLLPRADCARCAYRLGDSAAAHCYMFVQRPGERCGQFRARD